ncbi:DUF4081 domain-containing GNAT family N-acetyltransferase [Myceligenerans pegani]|uniref:GNAT family N-acetyltransferase n=1 Tax=Myceligenerans pegani TaxID=2776917 RepID=A0ABR9MUQ6_9MICO|nr:DUF4081 domain-containing GNAT family N-acetyltransferase [Myceligenerans sp. TRM 65318]MBE1874507.1 GNAT family N-acetyltransferase [Myceligenerans sp. TRM 65318]MBE3016778.1 GNAT family N-acetyltransferase [Myceligenerans sp. TRM 65318]
MATSRTPLHPRGGVRRAPAPGGPADARVLGMPDLPEALAVCYLEPVASVLAASRLEIATRSGFAAAGGQGWGFPATGPLEAVCWAGANLVPVVPDALGAARQSEAAGAFAALARAQGRRSSSIVGEREAALGLWDGLERYWPAPREIRVDQPSMAITRGSDVAPDPALRRSTLAELDMVLPACVRMFTEEVGYSPVAGGGGPYVQRVRSLIADGRSFIRTETTPRGRETVAFKAEVGAVAGTVAQIQGVWVDPLFRGRGWSVTGMSAVVGAVRETIAPVVSLYVNNYNERALATYRRVGFEQVGTFATVLF